MGNSGLQSPTPKLLGQNGSVRFGVFEYDPRVRELRRSGVRLRLQEQPLQILSMLLERPGELVTREELQQKLWPDTFVDFEHSLNAAIRRLRETLDDLADNPRFVETVPRRGYRFIAPVDQHQPAPPPRRRSSKRAWMLAGGAICAVAALALGWNFGLRRFRAKVAAPVFHRVTFGRGAVTSARFSPDGQTIVYSAAWEGKPAQIFSTRPDSPEYSSLGLGPANLVSISRSGMMAISVKEPGTWDPRFGTLARVPLAGGAPREVMEHVQAADWAPNGTDLALARVIDGRGTLEFPAGQVLYKTTGWIGDMRVSPRGDLVAFLDHPVVPDDRGSVMLVNLAGQKTVLSDGWESLRGLAWSPDGKEVWFAAARMGLGRAIYAVTLTGKVRSVLAVAGGMSIKDISQGGRVLLTRDTEVSGIMALAPGETKERDLSWLDWSLATDLSPDGKTLLFDEQGEVAGPSYEVGLRKMDGSPPVVLGSGMAQSLSPDGKWALAMVPPPAEELVVLPTGAGNPKTLSRGAIEHYTYGWAKWFPDGKRIVFTGNEAGHKTRCYVQDLAAGEPRALTPEGTYGCLVSPDGQSVFAIAQEGEAGVFPVASGRPRRIATLPRHEMPIVWSADGRSIFLFQSNGQSVHIDRLNLGTGRSSPWKQLAPSEQTGQASIYEIAMTPDGSNYAYTYIRELSDLYLVDGLK